MATRRFNHVQLRRAASLMVACLMAATAVLFSIPAATQPAHAAGNDATSEGYTLIHPQDFFAYAKAGEEIKYTFTVGDGTTNPNKDAAIAGVIQGPQGDDSQVTKSSASPATGTTIEDSLTASHTGVYRIRLGSITSDGSVNYDNNSHYLSNLVSFDIGVSTDTGTSIAGRVWSDTLMVYSSGPADVTLWYLSAQGYVYRGKYLGYDGIESSFAADAFGVVNANECSSVYRSVTTVGTDASKYTIAPASCGGQYRVFIGAPPSSDLPETSDAWFDGRTSSTTTWVKPEISDPTVKVNSFVPSEDHSSRAGDINATITNFSGQVSVTVANADTGNVLRTYSYGTEGDGPNFTIPFDGNDDAGNPIAASTELKFTIGVKQVGEIHFVNGDVELRSKGIEVTALNGPDEGSSKLYWDDEHLTQLPAARQQSGSQPDPLSALDGKDSTDGVHAWSCFTSSGEQTTHTTQCNADQSASGSSATDRYSWGDRALIDDWTYASESVSDSIISVASSDSATASPSQSPSESATANPSPSESAAAGSASDAGSDGTGTASTLTPVASPTSATSTASTKDLAKTGEDLTTITAFGAALLMLVFGGVVLFVHRRRRPNAK